MLNNAADMAQTSEAALRRTADNKREKSEADGKEAAKKARFDALHREFEVKALASARAGKLFFVVPGHELSIARLNTQGFVVKQLTRCMEFETHLEFQCTWKQADLVRHCDRIVASCPGLDKLDGDALVHRNPLMSLMETIWRKKGITEPFEVERLLAYTRTLNAAYANCLERTKDQLKEALNRFEDLKLTASSYQSKRFDNLTITNGESAATYVSWETSEDGAGVIDGFTAQRLKWVATCWPEAASHLAEIIHDAASAGRFESERFIRFNGETWHMNANLNAIWPVEEDYEELDFCKPSIAVAELVASGYQVELEEISESSEATVTPQENCDPSHTPLAYCMRIHWA